MTGVDIAHFDRDWHNSLYYFIINADKDIYLRYGGRDEAAADTYLNLESLEVALRHGLNEHRKNREKKSSPPVRSQPIFPRDYPLLKRDVISQGRCVECHLVGDYMAKEKEQSGLLNPMSDVYQSPDIKNLGLFLDIPKGLVLAKSLGSAKSASVQAGDLITSINGHRVLTFGDLQYAYNQVSRQAEVIKLGLKRQEKNIELTIKLPKEWWKTDTSFRHWSVEPRLFFKAVEISTQEKEKLNLPLDGFASCVGEVEVEAILGGYHSLEIGDVITGVNGVMKNPLTTDLLAHITLKHAPGEELALTVLRKGKEVKLNLKTSRLNFRKVPATDESHKPVSPSGNWSDPASIYYGKEKVLTYRAALSNDHLIIEAKHEKGWHSFALDNQQRAVRKTGKVGDQELPTVVKLPESLKSIGEWLQSPPADFSQPEIHWHTWGHSGVRYFAIQLSEPPKQDIKVSVSSQACNKSSCAGGRELELVVKKTEKMPSSIEIQRVLSKLERILPSATKVQEMEN